MAQIEGRHGCEVMTSRRPVDRELALLTALKKVKPSPNQSGCHLINYFSALAVIIVSTPSFAGMASYTPAKVNWASAIQRDWSNRSAVISRVRTFAGYNSASGKISTAGYEGQDFAADLVTINAITSTIHPKIHFAGSPVLLPIDIDQLTKGMIETGKLSNKEKVDFYFGTLKGLAFYPGAYGYRAYFRLKKTSTVMISGSSIFYQIPAPEKVLPELQSCESLIMLARKAAQQDEKADEEFFKELGKYDKKIGLKPAYFGESEATVPCMLEGALVEINILH